MGNLKLNQKEFMGYCCSDQGAGEVGNLSTSLYPQGQTLNGIHYTTR